MVLDWWMELGDGVLTVEYARFCGIEKVSADVSGQKLAVQKKAIRHGSAFTFAAEKSFTVNSIVRKGERYVSLYCGDELVKEYCYARERAASAYDINPSVYDNTFEFVKTALWLDAVIAGFILSLALIICGLKFDVFKSMAGVAVISLAIFALGYAAAFGVHALLYFLRRRGMAKFGIVRPINDDGFRLIKK